MNLMFTHHHRNSHSTKKHVVETNPLNPSTPPPACEPHHSHTHQFLAKMIDKNIEIWCLTDCKAVKLQITIF